MHRNIFSLNYAAISGEPLDLDKSVNLITGEDIKRIGMQIDQKFFKEKFFTIEKFEYDGVLNWKLTNESFTREVHINCKNNPGEMKEVTLRHNESYIFKHLLREKIYFNKNNQSLDYLDFKKRKVLIEFNLPDRKSEDEPLEINYEDIKGFCDDNPNFNPKEEKTLCEFPLRNMAENKENKENNSNLLNHQEVVVKDFINLIPDEDDNQKDNQTNSILNESFVDDILKNYENLITNKEDNIVNKCSIDDNSNNPNNINNTNNISKIKLTYEPSKKAKIIIDDEEESINKDKSVVSPTKSEDDDYFITNAILNSLIEQYDISEYEQKENLNSDNIITTQSNLNNINLNSSNKKRIEYKNITYRFSGESFNSNGKRPHYNYKDKENDDFLSFKSKRLKKATENKELLIDPNTTCAICLDSIKILANLNNCSHDFCKPCIIEWSKNTNLCPLCKKEFKKIIYYERNKKKELKVKRKKLEVDDGFEVENEEESSDHCLVCGENNDFSNMLVCDGCQYNVCHTYCDGLSIIPDTEWFCAECKRNIEESDESRLNLTNFLRRDLEASDEFDEEYEPKIILEDDEEFYNLENDNEGISECLDDVIKIIGREGGRMLRRSTRGQTGNNNNNISLNISLNVNVPSRRITRRSDNRSSSSNVGNSTNNIETRNQNYNNTRVTRNRTNNN